ncbi:MAG: hypothetical protein QW404_02675 [Candidatus Nanoarchaeia archaeon]
MDNKKLGIALIIAALIIVGIFFYIKSETERLIDIQVAQTGSCYQGSICSHERANTTTYIGIGLAAFIAALGFYLLFFEKGHKILMESQEKITTALQKERKDKAEEEKFQALMAGLDEDEKKVIKVVREEEGIQQSTLKYRVGLSKTKLSMVIKSLETKKLITKEEAGKTNKIFLKKPF